MYTYAEEVMKLSSVMTLADKIQKGYKTVIKASAGTGKTYRLSLEYIANMICGISYENIVVMTFTKKATAEIKDRIFEFLEDIVFEKNDYKSLESNLSDIFGINKENIDKEVLKKLYIEMIKNKEDVRIYTIDGFTSQIFKNTIAPYLGIYGFETLDIDKPDFYNEILISIFKNEDYMKKFEFVFDELKENRKIETYLDFLKEIIDNRTKFILAKDYKIPEKIVVNISFIDELESIFTAVEQFSEIKNKELKNCFNKDDFEIYNKYKEIEEKKLDLIEERREKINLLIENTKCLLKEKIWNGTTISKKTELGELLLESFDKFKENFCKYIFNEKLLPLQNNIIELKDIIFKLCDEKKKSEKALTHNDVTNYTYEFIYNEELSFVKEGKVTDKFFDLIGGRIDTIMIDEFQDTSVLQWKILILMMNATKNIICVGDEKQSIYSWRGGEKQLFEKLENLIDADVEELDRSYRSYKEIMENVNSVFTGIKEDWNYSEVKYRTDEEYQKGYFGYHIKEHPTVKDEDSDPTEKAIENIVEMLKSGEIKNVGNTCIIARTGKQLNEIAERLNEENISYTINSNASLLEHKAVDSVYKLIKYFSTNNFIYLLEFLRSDLMNYSNAQMKQYIDNVVESKYLKSDDFNDIEKNVVELILKLENDSKNLNNINAKEDFARNLISSFCLLDKYSSKSDIKNIFKFFNILKSYSNIQEFVQYIEEKRDDLTQLSSDDSLAVNLMTIHKSKGLEYETVLFYYNSTSKKPNDTSKFKMYVDYDKKYEHVVNFFITLRKYAGILEYTDYAAVDEQNAIKQEHEEMNALYVGLTRAKKNMSVFLDVKSYKGGEVKDILALKLRGLYSSVFDYKSGEIAENVKDDNKVKVEDYDIDILDYIDNTKFSKLDTNSFNKKLKLADEFKRKVGLAIHYYFEHIKNNIEIEKMQAESALFLKYGNLLGVERVENILARVQKFIDNNKEIYNSKYKVYTEFEITNENAEKRIIDRVNIDEDAKEITIYDYKTGEDPGNKEKYIKQLEEYKKIIEEKTNGEYKIMTKILEI